jgi:hypothetical protein
MLSQLLYDYQTLATGLFAVLAAVIGAGALVRQANTQRQIAEATARHRTKATIAALIAEVRAMNQHLIKLQNGAIAVGAANWQQNPDSIRQFHIDIPDSYKYYYRDSVVIPVRTATKIHELVTQLTLINGLVAAAASTADETQRQHYKDIGNQIADLYGRSIAVLDDLGRELEEEYELYIW